MTSIEKNLDLLKQNTFINSFLSELHSNCGNLFILGDSITDWILDKHVKEITIVTNCEYKILAEYLDKFKSRYSEVTSGYNVVISNMTFNISNLGDLLSFKSNNSIIKEFQSIPKTVFLSTDAVGYDLNSKELFDAGLHNTLSMKVLDIINEQNQFPFICASKALCSILKYDFLPSEKLKYFIGEQIARGYNKKSFSKYIEMKNIDYSFESCMKCLAI